MAEPTTTTTKSTETTICISHRKDADGLSSAALIKMATGSEIILADYGDLVETLCKVNSCNHLYICDLGMNEHLAAPFVKELERIRMFAVIHYIDHHPLDSKVKDTLTSLGVDLTHSLDECTSVLTYIKFKDQLKGGAAIIAAYGAVTDYADNQPVAKQIIALHDRQFVLLEATLLTYALIGAAAAVDEADIRSRVVAGLSENKFPHQIEGITEAAKKGLEATAQLMLEVAKKGTKGNQIAYMEVKEGSTGTVANLLVGAFEVPVGIAYRYMKDEDVYEVSLRGSYQSQYDLGKIVSEVTGMVGGSGGGHKKASGARIPSGVLKEFIDLVEFEIDKVTAPDHRGFARRSTP
ncbi:MAG: DHHA1 domain-containing protein [Thaumarchaeota archaeon]|nr:DHHA1 domain-containing protein [Nitrososphaerota archaeon]